MAHLVDIFLLLQYTGGILSIVEEKAVYVHDQSGD